MQPQSKETEMHPTQVTDWRELAQRVDDEVAITLLWSQRGSCVKVAVADDDAEEWE
jgi:hypothetical protein